MEPQELFRRECKILRPNDRLQPLVIRFFQPQKTPQGTDYFGRADISCAFFNRNIYSTGEDAAQAFLLLPRTIVSYLTAKQSEGFEIYWLERGDLNYKDYWGYAK